MWILESLRNGDISIASTFIIAQSLTIAILCYLLAKSKNLNSTLALLLGTIPLLNYAVVLYYIGMPREKDNK
jgi:hypothetical protein